VKLNPEPESDLVELSAETRATALAELNSAMDAHGRDRDWLAARLAEFGVTLKDCVVAFNQGRPVPRAVADGLTSIAKGALNEQLAHAARAGADHTVLEEEPERSDQVAGGELKHAVGDGEGWPFRLVAHGVEKRVDSKDKDSGEITTEWRWFCSRLEIVAETRNSENENWGRLLKITDRDRHQKEWAMPMSMLSGDGRDHREQLLSLGLEIAPGPFGRGALQEYISTARPGHRVRCVERMGWHGRLYVGRDETWGATDERYVLQRASVVGNVYGHSGNLASWQEEVARYAVGNSRLILALSAAFATVLLYPTGSESGGFHLRGGSSTGKTTALRVAGSVWGGDDFIRTWRATSNGLEGVAAHHCDGLLCLDEIGQVDGRQAGEIAYMLANGQGKARAGRSGEARDAAHWRLLFLSSGEVGLADKIAEEGSGRRIAAGQAVRVLDLAAEAGAGLGLFENLHGLASADELARHLKAASSEHYGEAMRAFMRALAKDVDSIDTAVKQHREQFIADHVPAGADGQVRRAADRFALVAAAGEMACAFDVLPWHAGEATKGVARCFRDWLAGRGGAVSAEELEAVSRVRSFIEANGNARFEPIGELVPTDRHDQPIDQRVQNRVGFRRRAKEGVGVEYLVLPEAWRSEMCSGMDAGFVTKTLVKRGLLETDSEGKAQVNARVPTNDRPIRVYLIKSRILEDEVNSARDDFDNIEF